MGGSDILQTLSMLTVTQIRQLWIEGLHLVKMDNTTSALGDEPLLTYVGFYIVHVEMIWGRHSKSEENPTEHDTGTYTCSL